MVLTSPDIAATLEAAEAWHLRVQAQTWRALGAVDAHAVEIGGGVAAFTEPLFGRKLNHVTGLGMAGPVDEDALARVEAAYARRGLGVEIDLCPHADASVMALLGRRGYVVNAFSNTYARSVDDVPDRVAPGIEILRSEEADALFVEASVEGFSLQAQQRPRELLAALARIAHARDDTSMFVARVDGRVAGSAGLSVMETPRGRVGELYIASTLPAFRGRGVQAALLKARLAAARDAGCALVFVGARPANTSARNVERAGFGLAFTKATFARAVAG
ncbi:MAG: GNAT family N-acetyltransferase [Burkholderiales bacterium]|nr:GNAT family N-acetyltransferase [Burkholderiales bacterium]